MRRYFHILRTVYKENRAARCPPYGVKLSWWLWRSLLRGHFRSFFPSFFHEERIALRYYRAMYGDASA
jgi:hypothetical protein